MVAKGVFSQSALRRWSTERLRFCLRLLAIAFVLIGVIGGAGQWGAVRALAAEGEGGTGGDEENLRYFTDLPVVTHEGEEVRFYSDLLKNKRIVISFFYVHCPTAQPTLVTLFKLQKKLGDRLGSEVVLLSISVDPERDSLEAVRDYARKFNPRNGWYFVTGKPENLDVINKRLGNTLRLPEGHLRQFILGNTRTNHWMRLIETAPLLALEDGLRTLEPVQSALDRGGNFSPPFSEGNQEDKE
ncbi:MAG: SCO family protein [Syntrophobacteraceae bacterium]